MNDAEVAVAAAEAGAEVIRARVDDPGGRTAKVGIDFVTETDLEAERAILDVIRAARPGDAFLGEEAGLLGDAGAERTWLVDPLCGTLNFAARTPLVAVNVALRVGTDLATSAVAEPFSREVSWTDGTTARMRRAGVDEPVHPSAANRLVDIDLDGDPTWGGNLVPRIFGAGYRALAISSSLALAWVASGRRAAYIFRGDVRDNVHFAAPIALCRAAGCVVTGLGGQSLESGILVAADEQTHRELAALVL